MTPSYPELVSAVRRDGEALVAACGQGLDAEVPTCPGWTVTELARHVAKIYARIGTVVGERLTAPPSELRMPTGETATEVLAETLEELVEALRSCEADTPMWNWSHEPQVAAFWARRMAHESSVHRYDAQRAHGLAQPIDADLARDGIDELVDVILPLVTENRELSLPTATYVLTSEDEAWNLRVDGSGIQRVDAAKEPDVTARGTTSALLLAAYNRVPWSSLDVDGDIAALEAWSATFTF